MRAGRKVTLTEDTPCGAAISSQKEKTRPCRAQRSPARHAPPPGGVSGPISLRDCSARLQSAHLWLFWGRAAGLQSRSRAFPPLGQPAPPTALLQGGGRAGRGAFASRLPLGSGGGGAGNGPTLFCLSKGSSSPVPSASRAGWAESSSSSAPMVCPAAGGGAGRTWDFFCTPLARQSRRTPAGSGEADRWVLGGLGAALLCPRAMDDADNQFRMSILERLEQMEKRLAEMTAASAATSAAPQTQQRGGGEKPPSQVALDCFEERIVALCEKMMVSHSSRLRSETLVHHVSFRGMTLLHLAAAQGYTHLIETLIKWRSLNAQSLDLEQEVDPLNVDHFSCTPLMWACALGHLEAAQLLYRWNSRALSIPDSLGRLPLTVARSRGHVRLATRLEEMQRQEESPLEHPGPELGADAPGGANKGCSGPRRPAEALRIPSPLSASPDTGLSTASGVSSPSERSEGSVSITSAYSSGSALRESPAYSPEAEGAMDVCQAPGPESVAGWYLGEAPSPQGLPHARFFIDYSEVEAAGHGGAPQPDLEPELLGYGENTENEEYLPTSDVLQVDMVTLAKQIIEATPERIKQEDFSASEAPLRERPGNLGLSDTVSWLAGYLENVEQLPSFSQRRSLASSPTGHACLSPLHSPLGELSFERLPPPPTAASWAEFLNASGNGKMESDFALLTLSDHEQRELYEAAKIIQTAFRKYKGRRLKEQQEMAAAVIQRCYRKYKQYALYKKMTQAAILIQSKFRSYYEQKRFQQSRRAAVLIQQYYRSYKEYEKLKQGHRASTAMQQKIKWIPRRLAPPERGTFLTKKQDQAARKIMRFLRRCRHRMKELKQQQEGEPPSQKRGVAT